RISATWGRAVLANAHKILSHKDKQERAGFPQERKLFTQPDSSTQRGSSTGKLKAEAEQQWLGLQEHTKFGKDAALNISCQLGNIFTRCTTMICNRQSML